MNINFNENIKLLRKQKEITQEVLAEYMDVSVQAVSKWECGLSYPDIESLPKLADFFGVTIDYLLTALNNISKSKIISEDMPDDNVLRIVQYKGKQLLTRDTYNSDLRVPLEIDEKYKEKEIHVEIWGSANINGNVSGGVNAGNMVNCGDVAGGVNAGDAVNCGNVGGGVCAGDSVNCGNVGSGIDAGDSVNCGNVGGGISAGDSISCLNIDGDITSCGGDIHCHEIKGNATCSGNVYIKT